MRGEMESCNYWIDVFLLLLVNGVKTLFGTLETLTGHWTRATWNEARGKIFLYFYILKESCGSWGGGSNLRCDSVPFRCGVVIRSSFDLSIQTVLVLIPKWGIAN